MLSRIHIKNFRSFGEIEIGPFNRVNLIAGLNNTGKTGLLEAIYLGLVLGRKGFVSPSPEEKKLPNLFRVFSPNADQTEDFWLWLLHDKRPANDIQIQMFHSDETEAKFWVSLKNVSEMAKTDSRLQEKTRLGPLCVYGAPGNVESTHPPAVFSSQPSDPVQDAIDYNRVILKRAKKKVEKLLKSIDPRLEGVESLQTSKKSPLIYADVGLPEMIPVTHLGEGFCRLLDIYSELLAGDAKVLLIDEIENGLHHSVLPIVWKGLIAAANELDVQIFATTHSAECIFAADQAARESPPHELNLIRLDRVNGEVKATVMDEKTLSTAKEFNWELR